MQYPHISAPFTFLIDPHSTHFSLSWSSTSQPSYPNPTSRLPGIPHLGPEVTHFSYWPLTSCTHPLGIACSPHFSLEKNSKTRWTPCQVSWYWYDYPTFDENRRLQVGRRLMYALLKYDSDVGNMNTYILSKNTANSSNLIWILI